MQNQQSNLQGQTGQPVPNVQDPQAGTNSNLQQTLDLQNIDSSQTTIAVPGEGSSTTASVGQDSTVASSDSSLLGVDISAPLLVTIFVAAVVIIGLLAKLAKPRHELYPESDQIVETDTNLGQASDVPIDQTAPYEKKTGNKKMTRRQRRNQSKRKNNY